MNCDCSMQCGNEHIISNNARVSESESDDWGVAV